MLELPETFIETTLGDVADSNIVEIGGCNSGAYTPSGYFSWYLHKRIQSVGFSFTHDVRLTGFVPKVRSWKIMRRQIEKEGNQDPVRKTYFNQFPILLNNLLRLKI